VEIVGFPCRNLLRLVFVLGCFFAFDPMGSVSRGSNLHSTATLKSVSWEGRTFLILEIRPKKGWHLLSNYGNPAKEDAFLVDWKHLPDGFDGGWVWSTPERIQLEKGYRIGYQDRLVLLMESSKRVYEPARAQFFWSVCHELCETESAFLISEPSEEEAFRSILTSYGTKKGDLFPLPPPENWKARFRSSGDRLLLKLETGSDTIVQNLDFLPIHDRIQDLPQIVRLAPDEWRIEVLGAFPEKEVVSGFIIADRQSYKVDFFPETSFVLIQAGFLAFLGGILLNLMPCVFPVLAMKAMGVIQSSTIDPGSRWKDSFFYSLGVVLFFGILYLIQTGIRYTGTSLGWGFQLQSPGFVLFLSILFVFMGLQMYGWIEFPIGVSGKISGLSDRKGYVGSFFSGAIAVLVATPCTAPFMGTAMAYAFSESFFNGLWVFVSLALGMASPMVILTNSKFLARLLPKPGLWMVKLKEFFSFPLFLTSVWLLWILSGLTDRDSLFLGAGGIVVLIFIVWIFRQVHSVFYKSLLLSLFLALIIFLVISIQDAAKKNPPPFSDPKANIQPRGFGFKNSMPYGESTLQSLLDSEAPVFLYFTADWCVTCKFNERQVFSHPDVEAIFQSERITVLKADWTNEDETITRKLESFGRNGVPLYVFYPGRAQAKPRILPQILTVQSITHELRN